MEVLMVIVVEKVADVGVVDASELGHPTRRSGGGLLRSTPETSRRLSSQIAKSPDTGAVHCGLFRPRVARRSVHWISACERLRQPPAHDLTPTIAQG
jgi:hypothetical protein